MKAGQILAPQVDGSMDAPPSDTLDFYRDAYTKAHARAEALEASRDRLFEQAALHTEAYGIVCAERDAALKSLSDGTLRWIPVTERMPERRWPDAETGALDSIDVLFFATDGDIYIGCYQYDEERWWNTRCYRNATHWMPLPEAPK